MRRGALHPAVRLAAVCAVLAAAPSCRKDIAPQGRGGAEASVPILFGAAECKSSVPEDGGPVSPFAVRRTPLSACPATKVSPVSDMDSFYLTVLSGGTALYTNTVFTPSASGAWSGGLYWPAQSAQYVFCASSASMTVSGTRCLVTCTGGEDVVCARNGSPAYLQSNVLTFGHVLARVGSVEVSLPAGMTASLTGASVTCPVSGKYDVNAQSWASRGTSSARALSSSNDLWAVPGTYDLSVTYSVSDGSVTRTGITRSGSVTLEAGCVNDIVASAGDSFTYSLAVSPADTSIYIGTQASLRAVLTTMYGGQAISVRDVTPSASWSSSASSVASVSAGTVSGLAAGTAAVTASWGSVSGSSSVKVSDRIVSYGTPSVTLTYPDSPAGASGGVLSPSLSYSQTVTWASGKKGAVTSGGSVSWSMPSSEGFALDASTGAVTVSKNGSQQSRTATVTAAVTMPHGEKGTAVCTVTQKGALIIIIDD